MERCTKKVLVRAAIVAATIAASAGSTASADNINTPAISIADVNTWHDLFVNGLDSGSAKTAASGTLDFWFVPITNASGVSWDGLSVRFSQDSGGQAMSFVTHFEPSFTDGAWIGNPMTLNATFDQADFDALSAGASPLLDGSAVTLRVPSFNPSDVPQTYHLQIMAVSSVPSPGAFVLLIIAAAIPLRRGGRRAA